MSSADPRIGIAIITRNRCEEILRTLQRLQTLPERPAIVVVDNASSDDTVAEVRRQFGQVHVIALPTNLGAAGRTVAARALEGHPYIALCDDDSWWKPGDLRRAADLLDRHPRLAVVVARVLVGPEQREDAVCELMARSPLPALAGLPGPCVLGFLACSAVVRRTAFLEVGGFRTDLGVGGEEEWLAVDLAVRGWSLCYAADLTVHHWPSSHRDARRRRWHSLRNAIVFAWLRRPVASALRRTGSLMLSSPWDRTTLAAAGSGLRDAMRLLPSRRVVPRKLERHLRLLEISR